MRTYFAFAVAFSCALLASSISFWSGRAVYWSATEVVWIIFILPGFAALLRDPANRRALVLGVSAAAIVFGGVALHRLIQSDSPFDVTGGARIFGVKRDAMSYNVLFALPLILCYRSLARSLRILVAVFCVISIVLTGGRSGLLGLAAVVLAYAIAARGAGRRMRALVVAVCVAVVSVFIVAEMGGPAAVGQNRLISYVRGERSPSDESRELMTKRAWQLGWSHPFFGIGYDQVKEQRDHPVLQEASRAKVAELARGGSVLNEYLDVFAQFGLLALLSFLAILAVALRAVIPRRASLEARAAIASFIGGLVMLLFLSVSFELLFYAIAFMLALEGSLPSEISMSGAWTTRTIADGTHRRSIAYRP
jgi:O-antigen ligase